MQDNLRCTKCGMTFEAGKIYGYACVHGLNCGPMVPITEPLPPWWPRQDVQLPPRWPEAADTITALRAEVETHKARADAAFAAGVEAAAQVAEVAPYRRGGIICGCSEGLAEWTAAAIRALTLENTP